MISGKRKRDPQKKISDAQKRKRIQKQETMSVEAKQLLETATITEVPTTPVTAAMMETKTELTTVATNAAFPRTAEVPIIIDTSKTTAAATSMEVPTTPVTAAMMETKTELTTVATNAAFPRTAEVPIIIETSKTTAAATSMESPTITVAATRKAFAVKKAVIFVLLMVTLFAFVLLPKKCDVTNYVDNNECKVCKSGFTCDGWRATKCDVKNYVDDNTCKPCPKFYKCDGTKAIRTLWSYFMNPSPNRVVG